MALLVYKNTTDASLTEAEIKNRLRSALAIGNGLILDSLIVNLMGMACSFVFSNSVALQVMTKHLHIAKKTLSLRSPKIWLKWYSYQHGIYSLMSKTF